MSAVTVGAIVFGCVFGGALLGMLLRAVLPQHHLSTDTKDVVKLGIGLVGTMTALLLGLLVSSAKNSYDTQKSELTQMSAKIVFLDRTLAFYGPETKEAREQLRLSLAASIDQIWPTDGVRPAELDPSAVSGEALYNKLQQLSPQGDAQRSFKDTALGIAREVGQMRWLLFEQAGRSISTPFLVVVVFWLAVIFVSFGLFAPRNATVIVTLMLCALSVSAAIFLVLELDHPFSGLIHISSDTMRSALAHLGQ